jgi:thiol-disulfide isomerase/thioredoxin
MSMKRALTVLTLGLLLNAGAHAAGLEARDRLPAPEMRAADLSGAPRTLADYRGKVVVLNFWASWCPPCLREMPSLERLRIKMAGRPLEIVALDSAETQEEVEAYLSRMKLGFPVLLDENGSNTRRWKVFALPTTFVLDADSRIRYVLKGPTEWDEGEALRAIESLLAELPHPKKD